MFSRFIARRLMFSGVNSSYSILIGPLPGRFPEKSGPVSGWIFDRIQPNNCFANDLISRELPKYELETGHQNLIRYYRGIIVFHRFGAKAYLVFDTHCLILEPFYHRL